MNSNPKVVNKLSKKCKFCDKIIIGNSFKFRAHLYRHRAVAPRFKCTVCAKDFFRKDAYTRHMDIHSGELGTKKRKFYICDYCDRGFANKRNLIYHLSNHDDAPMYRYKCIACGVTYCEDRLLKYHIRKAHFNLNTTDKLHVKKEVNETWLETVKESPLCVEMTKINKNVVNIKKFSTIKTEKKESGIFEKKTELKSYISSVFGENKTQYSRATCDYCKKEMLKKSLLSHIRERHLKLKKFKCDECDRSFARHYQLVDHICGKPRRRRRVEKKEVI